MSTVVIGANFGDEGKGLITDFEVRRHGGLLVARFNGGAQAGHTVCDAEGYRHIFSHVGAGTFAGADTYLSSEFLVNPLAFRKEYQSLKKKPVVTVHPGARVTTVFDMVINGLAEHLRGNDRHGSCGMGINETVTRDLIGPRLHFADVIDHEYDLAGFLEHMHSQWIPFRLRMLGIDAFNLPKTAMTTVLGLGTSTKRTFERHAEELRAAAANLRCLSAWNTRCVSLGLTPTQIVFEGAQGLALDEYLGQYPHVTRSTTGLVGAINASNELGCRELSPVYVTRVYLTRHGAGPLSNEGDHICNTKLVDATNKSNEWQGHFRYAPLNLPQMKRLIELDFARGKMLAESGDWPVQLNAPTLAVTCLDQVGETVRMIGMNNVVVEVPAKSAANYIADVIGIKLSHSSWGPSAQDVRLNVQ